MKANKPWKKFQFPQLDMYRTPKFFEGAADAPRRPDRVRVGVEIMIAHNPSTDPDKRCYRIRLLP